MECNTCLKFIKNECPSMDKICHLYTKHEVIDYSKSSFIYSLENVAPLVTCDKCGEERKCKPYPLNEGNAILCRKCHNEERVFQTSDSRGYTITDGSQDYYKRNFQSWMALMWYGLDANGKPCL